MLYVLPSIDSEEMGLAHKRDLLIPRDTAVDLGISAVNAAKQGYYLGPEGRGVDWSAQVDAARSRKVSIPPEAPLPTPPGIRYDRTCIQVSNETTFQASRRWVDEGLRPLALNFANGIQPGGGFLIGSRAQEEVLCRSSALHETLVADPMYEAHAQRPFPDSSDWAIYSPDVPVFRTDAGLPLQQVWLLSFLTCAAPYAPTVGQPVSGHLLNVRIHRILQIANAFGYSHLVLGAWGCGAFANDPHRTARDFRRALETDFDTAFHSVIFAITDWSENRRTLGPFRDVFSSQEASSTAVS